MPRTCAKWLAVATALAAGPGEGRAQAPEGMVRIPGATYTMGTDSAELGRIVEELDVPRIEMLLPETPTREVTVEPFLLDATEVTNADFVDFVTARPEWGPEEADPSLHNGRYLEHWTGGRPRPDEMNRPVTFVTWYAAVAYCRWADRRLPTEAEWEYAAGGGDPERRYPWGSEPPSDGLVSWGYDGIDHPVPVGSYPPNAFGLYDMAGNVWKYLADEWRDSHRGPLLRQDGLDPDTAASVRSRRTVRGGSWGAAAVNLRVRYRDSHRPFDAREMVGFRCARTAG